MRVGPSFMAAIAALGMLVAGAVSAAIEPVLLLPTDSETALATNTRFAIDARASATAEDEFGLLDSDTFRPLPHDNATFGFVDGAYWFHVRLLNRDTGVHRRILAVNYPLLDTIDFYLRRADGSVTHARSGDTQAFSQRALRSRMPNFLIDLDDGEQADLLIRVRSESSMQVPLVLYSQKAFFERTRDSYLGVGLYYGILLSLLLYNLILLVSLRDANYFYYTLYVAGFGLVQLCLNGLAFEYLWPGLPWLANTAVPVSMALGMLLMHQFVRAFLDLRQRLPVGNRILLGFISFHAMMVILSMFIDYRTAVLLGTASVFPGATAILGVCLILARRGDRAAQILLIAWAVLLIGTTTYAMVSFGLLPKMFATEYGMQIGSALEMILLSFALAWRFSALRNENIRIVQTARNELEVRVEERTHELSLTLNELASANERLRESSLRDGLTGVYNRRYFDAEFASMLAECRSAGHPFGVLVADIDHFKRVNDEAGHLVGDDCLRLAAATIEMVVGQRGSVIRYGGEEFVVLLPDAIQETLTMIAEAIRVAVARNSLDNNGTSIPLTISIGVAMCKSSETVESTTLLQRADEAMYQAKHQGRNRVVVY